MVDWDRWQMTVFCSWTWSVVTWCSNASVASRLTRLWRWPGWSSSTSQARDGRNDKYGWLAISTTAYIFTFIVLSTAESLIRFSWPEDRDYISLDCSNASHFVDFAYKSLFFYTFSSFSFSCRLEKDKKEIMKYTAALVLCLLSITLTSGQVTK